MLTLKRSLKDSGKITNWSTPVDENMILEYMPTLLFIEHDEMFCEKVSNKPAIILEN